MSTPQLSTISSLQTTVAAQATAATAQAATVTSLETTVGNQAATIAAQSTAAIAQAATVTSLETTVATQAATIAAQAATVAATSALCPGMAIKTDAHLALFAPATQSCVNMAGDLELLNGVSNVTLLALAFPNLRVVSGFLSIVNNPHLRSLEGTFQNLQSVGGQFNIVGNRYLRSIGSSFSSIQSVGGTMNWFRNGGQTSAASTAGSRSFCASARGALCPTTTSYTNSGDADDSARCCNAYCATTNC